MLCNDVRAYLLAPAGPAPTGLAEHLAACPACAAVSKASASLDLALQKAVLAEPPADLQVELALLVPATSPRARLALAWQRLTSRPWVLAGQLAAFALLVYALVQVFAWLGSSALVLGDVPYALELLVLSPAIDYASQAQALAQQLGLWMIVAAVGWLLAQGSPWPNRRTAP